MCTFMLYKSGFVHANAFTLEHLAEELTFAFPGGGNKELPNVCKQKLIFDIEIRHVSALVKRRSDLTRVLLCLPL
jgi:hypothetical protein